MSRTLHRAWNPDVPLPAGDAKGRDKKSSKPGKGKKGKKSKGHKSGKKGKKRKKGEKDAASGDEA
ncbi:MAG: hypothetical protein DUD33_07830 [Coriobacteriaceae bacterium]|nr:MAG: hypothetical protein DUD33_07830 [Coriobacteriaceae bacterium]